MAWISIAPVKGLGLVAADAVELTPEGVVENRRFHLVDDRGRMINGKLAGPLVCVGAAYDDAAQRLCLTFPGGEVAEGEVELGEPITSRFYGRPRTGNLVRGPFSDALSAHAGVPLRLVRPQRPSAAQDRGRGGAVSMLSTAAVGTFDPRRFRMLFGVDGVPAHAEDDWVGHRVRIGDAIVRPTGHTGRCLVTSQNPDTGRADMDMLEHLRRTRGDLGTAESLPFGVHGSVAQPGRVAVGDAVALLA